MEEIEEVDLERGSSFKIEEFGPEQGQKVEHQKDVDDSLMNCMRKRLEALPEEGEQRSTIFRVPEIIRKSRPHLFEPAVVSIGPYHRHKEHLRGTEEKKWPLLRDFLAKAENISLETCITEMKALEPQARKFYYETINMDSDAFVEMMLLDGSFIIQFLLFDEEGSEINTPFEDAGWNAIMIPNDLILIENQIPFIILEKMCFYLYGEKISSEDLECMASQLATPELISTKLPTPPKEIYHLLHLCHQYTVPTYMFDLEPPINHDKTQKHSYLCPSWLPKRPKVLSKTCFNLQSKTKSNPSWSPWSLPCATELQEAGVQIKKKKSACHFTDVTFRSGVLEIPALRIGDEELVIIMNLVALEQGFPKMPQLISPYCTFMDAIVNTANDATILQRLNIIDNMLSGEEEVALYFNQSCQHVNTESDHYLAELFKKINEYCNKKRHRNRAKLMRDYFSNPWSMLSLGAAIFIILLTCTQTVYAIFAYHLPPR